MDRKYRRLRENHYQPTLQSLRNQQLLLDHQQQEVEFPSAPGKIETQ
jgi:hypothetical protein